MKKIVILTISLTFLFTTVINAAELRLWTVAGKEDRILGELVKISDDGKTVLLWSKEGAGHTVPVAHLSIADQVYVGVQIRKQAEAANQPQERVQQNNANNGVAVRNPDSAKVEDAATQLVINQLVRSAVSRELTVKSSGTAKEIRQRIDDKQAAKAEAKREEVAARREYTLMLFQALVGAQSTSAATHAPSYSAPPATPSNSSTPKASSSTKPPEKQPCVTCAGTGKVTKPCGGCNGSGTENSKCMSCKGTGSGSGGRKCVACNGKGWAWHIPCSGTGTVTARCDRCNGSGYRYQ